MRATPASRRVLVRTAASLLAVAATVLLGGCVKITGATATQVDTLGPLRTEHTVCIALGGAGTCPSASPSGVDSGKSQILLAYRVPTWAPTPTGVAFVGTGSAAGTNLAFTPSSTYAAELQSLLPRTGTKWIGFVSQTNPAIASGATVTGKLTATWPLPDAQPAAFSVFTMTGFRVVDGAVTSTRAVNCATEAFGSPGFDVNDSVCSTGWWPNDGDSDADPSDNTQEIVLRNRLAVTGPAGATVAAGASATVNFTTAGAVPFLNANVPVATSTSVPGGTATVPEQTPIAGDHDVPVTVTVPATTPPGGYSVRLTVGAGLGAKVVDVPLQVVASAAEAGPEETIPAARAPASTTTTPPAIESGAAQDRSTFAGSAAVAGLEISTAAGREALRAGRLRIKVRASGRGLVEATLKSGRTLLAKGRVTAKRKGLVTVKLKLRPAGRAALQGRSAIDGTLNVRFKPRGRAATSTSVAVSLPATS